MAPKKRRVKPGPQIPPDQRVSIYKLEVDLKRRQLKDAAKKAFGFTLPGPRRQRSRGGSE